MFEVSSEGIWSKNREPDCIRIKSGLVFDHKKSRSKAGFLEIDTIKTNICSRNCILHDDSRRYFSVQIFLRQYGCRRVPSR